MISFAALKLLAISFLYLATFGLAALEKFRGGGVPEWFEKQFAATFLPKLPGGLTAAYFTIAILEGVIALLVLTSLVRLEFFETAPLFLTWALHLALFAFAMLGFGLRLAGDYIGTANLFFYFGATLVAIQALGA